MNIRRDLCLFGQADEKRSHSGAVVRVTQRILEFRQLCDVLRRWMACKDWQEELCRITQFLQSNPEIMSFFYPETFKVRPLPKSPSGDFIKDCIAFAT